VIIGSILPQLIVDGVALGTLYSLIAFAFVITFRATETLNFALGSFLVMGGLLTAELSVNSHLGFWPGFLLACVIVTATSMLVERFLVRPMIGRTLFVLGVLTIGVDLIISTFTQHVIGDNVFPEGDPWGSKVVHFLGVSLPDSRVTALIVAIVIGVGFFVWFKYTAWGVAMRASAEDSATAALMGVRLGRVSMVAWAISGLLAAIAGMFLSTFPTLGADPSLRDVSFSAFPAAALGGFDSTTGAIVGGMLIGLVTEITEGYENHLTFLGTGLHTIVPYVLLVLVLLVAPNGLFGTKEVRRV
jgi:branched-chain amino acid transport system permease protein